MLGLSLARDIEFEALRDVPVPVAPDGRGEWSPNEHILSQVRGLGARLADEDRLRHIAHGAEVPVAAISSELRNKLEMISIWLMSVPRSKA